MRKGFLLRGSLLLVEALMDIGRQARGKLVFLQKSIAKRH